jgi:site-specific recombinase XerD
MKAASDQLPVILLTETSATVPALIAARGQHAGRRFVEFFTANIRNPNTRRAYYRAVTEFFDWCDQARLNLLDIEPVHVAAWVEKLGREFSPPSVKQWLAAVRMLFDWLVVGQVLAVNRAAAVRGPKYVVRTGKTPVLAATEARQLLDSIDTTTVIGLRDRALIGLLVFTFARIGAALGMTVADVYWQHRRLWVRLHEKGGKEHAMPCHHHLETYLQDYIKAAKIVDGSRWSVVSHDRSAHGCSDGSHDDAVRRLAYVAASRRGRRHSHGGLQSHLSRHRHHRLSRQWRLA